MSMLADHDELSVQATAAPLTSLPLTRERAAGTPVPRVIRRVSLDDVLMLGGAAISSVSLTLILFGRLTAMSGKLGFVVVCFGLFLAIYATLVSQQNNVPAVIDRVMTSLLTAAAAVAGAALVSVVVFTLYKGRSALFKSNLYTQDMSEAGPLDPLTVGGIKHAIVGSLIIIGIALIVTVPLGMATAVYLTETKGRLANLVRTVVTAMTALPSIVAGLFIFATWILILGFPRSGLAAAIAVSIMVLPIIIRSADVVLRLVPGNLREASAALGAPAWRSVWHVVLPTARSGLSTSVILGIARGIGETAPVLLTSGFASSINYKATGNPMMSLPLATFEFIKSPQQSMVARGFATAAVLMILVLMLFSLARFLGGRPAGRLSKGQARRAATQSAQDLARFQARASGVGRS